MDKFENENFDTNVQNETVSETKNEISPEVYTDSQDRYNGSTYKNLGDREVYEDMIYPRRETTPRQPIYSYNSDVAKRKQRILKVLLVMFLAIIVFCVLGFFYRSNNDEKIDNPISETTTVLDEGAPQLQIQKPANPNTNKQIPSASDVYDKVSDINVGIIVYKSNVLYTEGTGIIMGENDTCTHTYILTCAHVISDAGIQAVVQLEDGTRYDAEIVGYDARTDIGVLRIQAKGLKAAEFGNSDSLKVGSTVYAIGNPGGSALFGTFTDGKVSAIGRNITSGIGYDMVCIQHNAAISPGNSGGALVNEYGQVIGVNSSKIAATEYEGIGFAIPIVQAKEIVDKIIACGYVPGRAKLGISYVANDNPSISGIYSMAVQMKELPAGSLVIYSIDKNSALSGTEAQPGDMITAVNGKKLDKPDVLLETIEKSSVGDTLTLSLFRVTVVGGQYQTSEFKVKAQLIEEKNTPVQETTTAGVYENDGSYFGNNFPF